MSSPLPLPVHSTRILQTVRSLQPARAAVLSNGTPGVLEIASGRHDAGAMPSSVQALLLSICCPVLQWIAEHIKRIHVGAASAQASQAAETGYKHALTDPPPPAPGVEVLYWFPDHGRLQFPVGTQVNARGWWHLG